MTDHAASAAIHVELELLRSGESLTGVLRSPGRADRSVRGWLDLLGAVEALLARHDATSTTALDHR